MTDFTAGEQVQLKRPYAKAIMGNRTVGPNWLERKGIVDHVKNPWVYVHWDGRKTIEQVPIKAVERAA